MVVDETTGWLTYKEDALSSAEPVGSADEETQPEVVTEPVVTP
jgi:hypothetical protein